MSRRADVADAGGHTERIARVMVIIEPFDSPQSAVREGIGLARAYGAELLLVDVPHPDALSSMANAEPGVGPGSRRQFGDSADKQHHQAEALDIAHKAGVKATLFGVASPYDLAQVADNQGCNLIVLANPGRNAVMRLLHRDLIPLLVTQARVPVLVCAAQADDETAR